MSDCGCEASTDTAPQRRVLALALALNAAMFVIGLTVGLWAQSTGLIADALDMLADALAFGIALAAIHRGTAFKTRAAAVNGWLLLLLGLGILADTARRAIFGSHPEGLPMLAVATLSLAVNAGVLTMLARYRRDEVHLRAAWIFTRADVIASAAVILSGLIVLLTKFRAADLIVGFGIGLYICKEATEILRQARAPAA